MAPTKKGIASSDCNINFNESTGEFRMQVPPPKNLICFCGKTRGTTKKTQRVNDMLLHLKEKHWKEEKPEITLVLICEKCGHEENT